jgi:hypothetical protein
MDKSVTNEAQPSRSETLEKLADLLAGRITREQASSWAARWVSDGGLSTGAGKFDDAVWEVLTALYAADVYGGDRPYLYDEADFREWAAELQRAPH